MTLDKYRAFARIAIAQAGALWGEFDRETQLFGLATVGGMIVPAAPGATGATCETDVVDDAPAWIAFMAAGDPWPSPSNSSSSSCTGCS